MQSRNAALKQDIQRLTLEIASGKVSDVREAIGGNSSYINDIERSLTKMNGYELATREANQFAEGVQIALSQMSNLNSAFRDTLIETASSALEASSKTAISEAKSGLSDLINVMNTSVAGRFIFGGTATSSNPVAPSENLLSELSAAVGSASTVDDMLAAAKAWFNDPAGFESLGYLGAQTSLAPISLSDDETAQFGLRGDDPAFREILQNFAMIALADDPSLGLTSAQQTELFQKSTSAVVGATDSIVELQARVGVSESRLETILVRQSAERSALEMARNDILGSDPFEAATELEQVQFQLQSLYAITSRMSQLSLVNFL
ncbi:flagellin [uncultured Sulfitobacter sp.]|uniref:flagellin n=1 Tax=uncultured Sulfitobacter sp. TaxID=191468 RepID=UPI0026393FB9|nr:flagellin [uncultured Sulfitobacter sp.]